MNTQEVKNQISEVERVKKHVDQIRERIKKQNGVSDRLQQVKQIDITEFLRRRV